MELQVGALSYSCALVRFGWLWHAQQPAGAALVINLVAKLTLPVTKEQVQLTLATAPELSDETSWSIDDFEAPCVCWQGVGSALDVKLALP